MIHQLTELLESQTNDITDTAYMVRNSLFIIKSSYLLAYFLFPTLQNIVYNILIFATNGQGKTGYPTQKPLGINNRIVRASSSPGDLVMDFFAGSGTVGESCIKLGRKFVLIDNYIEAIEVMAKRFADCNEIEWINIPKN